MAGTKSNNIFADRKVAAVICAIAILFSIWLGGGRGLNNERSEIESIYYNGVNEDGVSIQKDLSVRFQAAAKLVTLGEKYGLDCSAIAAAEEEYGNAYGIADEAYANALLDPAVYTTYNELMNLAELSEADKKSAQSLYNEINSRGNMIKNDGYNSSAQEFNSDVLGAFPANLIARLRGIKPLALFR